MFNLGKPQTTNHSPRSKRTRKTIEDVAVRTPLVDSPALSKRFGKEVYLKLECFQPIRVFKIRGAYNKVSQTKEKSIVAVSSGNHGMATAFSARAFGKKCTVILPENPVQEKADAIAEYGADDSQVREVPQREGGEGEADSRRRPAPRSSTRSTTQLVIAGQGTCGLEIVEQLSDFDSVVVPVGGGGLISGIAMAVEVKEAQGEGLRRRAYAARRSSTGSAQGRTR